MNAASGDHFNFLEIRILEVALAIITVIMLIIAIVLTYFINIWLYGSSEYALI